MPSFANDSVGKRAAEAKFPHRVDIRIPADGLGGALVLMLDWCDENIAPDAWDAHHHSEPPEEATPIHYVRFYFARETDAESFRGTSFGMLG